jgi:hypothetical protein
VTQPIYNQIDGATTSVRLMPRWWTQSECLDGVAWKNERSLVLATRPYKRARSILNIACHDVFVVRLSTPRKVLLITRKEPNSLWVPGMPESAPANGFVRPLGGRILRFASDGEQASNPLASLLYTVGRDTGVDLKSHIDSLYFLGIGWTNFGPQMKYSLVVDGQERASRSVQLLAPVSTTNTTYVITVSPKFEFAVNSSCAQQDGRWVDKPE